MKIELSIIIFMLTVFASVIGFLLKKMTNIILKAIDDNKKEARKAVIIGSENRAMLQALPCQNGIPCAHARF